MDRNMFNPDQLAYMDYLTTLPPEAKCGCKWYPKGECPNCKPECGGFLRCSTAYEMGPGCGPDILCTRKFGHDGEHTGLGGFGTGQHSFSWIEG